MIPLLANRWTISLPPIWLIGAGACTAALVALAGWAILAAVRPRAAVEARESLRDGFLGPLAWLLGAWTVVAVALTVVVPLDQIGRSLLRLSASRTGGMTSRIDAAASRLEVRLPFSPQELDRLTLETTAPLTVRVQQPIVGFALEKVPDVELAQAAPWTWQRAAGNTNPFVGREAKVEVTNPGGAPAELAFRWQLIPEYPQVVVLPWTAIVLTTAIAGYAVFRLAAPRLAAVAAATTKEAIGQPVFTVVLLTGLVLIVAFIVIPYNTFGEDVKMLKDSGLTLIKVLALFVVTWTASVAVSEEIEGRTAMTVLSKPLRRWQFILGKYAGLVLVAALVFLVLGGVLMATTSLKVVYDARENSKLDPLWRDCADEMITVVPGLALALLETIVMAAVSLAVSTRLGMVPNLIVCFVVYALGHLVPLVVQSSVGKFPIVRFVGQLLATLLPVLDHFSAEAAVIGGVPVPWSYLGWAALYAALYSTVALLVALVLFQDRDLA